MKIPLLALLALLAVFAFSFAAPALADEGGCGDLAAATKRCNEAVENTQNTCKLSVETEARYQIAVKHQSPEAPVMKAGLAMAQQQCKAFNKEREKACSALRKIKDCQAKQHK